MWHYPHLLLRAVLPPRAGRAAINPPSTQQQTRRTLLQQANRSDRRTDRRTDTAPLHKSCCAYYAGSAYNQRRRIYKYGSHAGLYFISVYRELK